MAATKRKSSARSQKESPDGAQLLVMELQEIHSAENQLGRILPRLAKAATSDKLRQMLEERQEEGETIIEEIDAAFEEMEASPGRKKNVAAEGLVNDAREHVQEIEEGPALDAVLIAAIQKTEHYCIAAWGTARSLAQAVGQKTAAKAMERALKEGKSRDERLTELAESEITPALLAGSEDEESEEADEADEADESEDQEAAQAPTRSRRKSGSERRAN
jgi:ferritin-like metal-binding protein YciE